MANASQAAEVFAREFLPIRAQVLALAAALDRLDRASGRERLDADERMGQVWRALEVLSAPSRERAARVQLIFSDPYEEGWIAAFTTGRG